MYQVGHASSGVVVETLYGVAVYVEGEGDGRMAKPIRHDLWVDACLQGQGGPGVAHVVEPDAWYCGPGDPAVEHLGNGFWVVVEAVRLGEKQVAVAIPGTHHQAFFELGPPMLAEQCASFRIEAHLATAPIGLEVGELRNMADDPQLPHQSEPPGFEVTVPPSQAENLAAPHPGHERNMPHDVEAVVASGIQERRNLAGGPSGHLGGASCSPRSRHQGVVRHVAHDGTPAHSINKGTMQDHMAVLDGSGTQATSSVSAARLGKRGVQVR